MMHALRVTRICDEANDMKRIQFSVPAELKSAYAFKPGQYLTLATEVEGEEIRRPYSICSAPGEPLEVAVKRIEGGIFSQYVHTMLSTGDQLEVDTPVGEFTSEEYAGQSKAYLMIAAGSGITPVISIIKSVLASEPKSTVTLLYGNRRATDIAFRDQLLWLKNAYLTRFQWVNILSREEQGAPLLNGRIDGPKSLDLHGKLIDLHRYDEYFLCGPEPMVIELKSTFLNQGVAAQKLHYELFHTGEFDVQEVALRQAERAKRYAGLNTQVQLRSGGRSVTFELESSGQNLLDAALDQGMDLPFSCKGGVCATCKARVLEGEVEMDRNHALSPQEVKQGYVLSCQSHPISQQLILDFDVI